MTQAINLTQNKRALVDDEDREWLVEWLWCAYHGSSGIWYAHRRVVVSGLPRRTRTITMHRQIMGLLDDKTGIEVDHINGNGLDNRRANLRLATRAQNSQNRGTRPMPGRTSKYKGVSLDKRNQLWKVTIRERWIGYFPTEIEAALAYNEAARELYGEFAWLNRVENQD